MKYREALQRTVDDATRMVDEGIEGAVRADEFVDDYRETAGRLAATIHEGVDGGETSVVERTAATTAADTFALSHGHPSLKERFVPPAGLELGAAMARLAASVEDPSEASRPKSYWEDVMESGYFMAYAADSFPDAAALVLDFEQTDAYPATDIPDTPPVREYSSEEGLLASVPYPDERREAGLLVDDATGEIAGAVISISPSVTRYGFTDIERYRGGGVDEEVLPPKLRDRGLGELSGRKMESDLEEVIDEDDVNVEVAAMMTAAGRQAGERMRNGR